jgi:hypothetical protein
VEVLKRLGGHLAGDVLRHTAAVSAVVVTLSLVQTAFRFAHELGNRAAAQLAARALEVMGEQLLACWPLICSVGFSGALALWVERRQHTIVASMGLPIGRIVGPGLALSLAMLATGHTLLSATIPARVEGRFTWDAGPAWGAALHHEGQGWRWVEFRRGAEGLEVLRGSAESIESLPEFVGRPAPPEWRFAGLWRRTLFLLLVVILTLRSMGSAPRMMRAIAYGGPLLGWFVWTSLTGVLSVALGSELGAELGGGALAFVLVGALGVGVLRVAER